MYAPLFIQLVIQPAFLDLSREVTMSKLKCELEGTSLATPETVMGVDLFIIMTLPMALSTLPKYFLAVDSVSTTLFTSFKTLAGAPLINGKEKRVKNPASTSNSFFSW